MTVQPEKRECITCIVNYPHGCYRHGPSPYEPHLYGRWSNGDPVHIITDGVNRRVAPNLNGATWIPSR